MDLRAALDPPLDAVGLLDVVPELSLARELEGSPYHHLDTLDHVLEVVRGVERELDEGRVGARVRADSAQGLRLAALLHDVAKPVTRGELEGRVLFVSHDSLGAGMVRRIGRRLGLSAWETDLTSTLTALHLKIGFMSNPRTDYPPERLARAAGSFGEELAVLSWADRHAAADTQNPTIPLRPLDVQNPYLLRPREWLRSRCDSTRPPPGSSTATRRAASRARSLFSAAPRATRSLR